MRVTLFAVLMMLALVACGRDPSVTLHTGDVLLRETFDQPHHWDSQTQGAVSMGVANGAYRMRSNVNSFVRGFYLMQAYENVVIDVRGVQFSQEENNAFGIVCRADVSAGRSTGYYFLIGADGSYSIREGNQDQVDALVAWARSGVINKGVATNDIRAVCIDDYLALYVNGEYLAEVRDRSYRSGAVGLTVAVEAGEQIEVAFDDLVILEGDIGE